MSAGYARTDSDFGVPTTRRFARSLSEAFPDVRAHCIERPSEPGVSRLGHTFVLAVSIVALCALVAVLLARRFA